MKRLGGVGRGWLGVRELDGLGECGLIGVDLCRMVYLAGGGKGWSMDGFDGLWRGSGGDVVWGICRGCDDDMRLLKGCIGVNKENKNV